MDILKQARPGVYLAGRYSRKAELLSYVPLFEAAGFEVTSRWITTPQHADIAGVSQQELDANPHGDRINEMLPEHQAAISEMDLEDIRRARYFVAFTEPELSLGGSRGGRHVEYGYAVALDKRVVICGPREAFFYHLLRPTIQQMDTVEGAVELLAAWQDLREFSDALHLTPTVGLGRDELHDDLIAAAEGR